MSEGQNFSRSRAIRTRREKRDEKRIRQSMDHSPKKPRLIFARGALKPAPKKPRRFQVAAAIPNMQLDRASAMPRLRAGWRLFSLFSSLVLGAAIYFAWTLPYFRVESAQVYGNARLSAADINAALALTGQPVFLVKPEELELRLRLNYPELSWAQVQVGLPNQIYVNVVERQPVIFWQEGQVFTWIDAEGYAFRPRGSALGLVPVVAMSSPPNVSSVTDPLSPPPPYITPDLVKAVVMLAPNAPPGSPIMYDANRGLGWKDNRGWMAFFGSESKNMALKIRVYQSLVNSLTARGMYPELINVAYPDAPYYRMAVTQ